MEFQNKKKYKISNHDRELFSRLIIFRTFEASFANYQRYKIIHSKI